MAPPKHTAVWPESAFTPAESEWERSDSAFGSGKPRRRSALLPRPSRARHPHEAARFANPVIQSYMVADTYEDYRGLTYKLILILGLLMAPGGLLGGWVYRKYAAEKIVRLMTPRPDMTCFRVPNDNCSDTMTLYVWNTTNAEEVLAGAPPVLQEVGPFTLRRTTAKYNIAFDHARRRVDWQYLIFEELLPEQSCAACTADATIIGPSSQYAGLMHAFDWSEASLLLQFVPSTLASLMDGMSSVLRAMAAQPGLVRLFPGLAASPEDAALAQWAQCGALGGTALRALGSDAVNAALPWAPEFCGWATAVMGVPLADARLPLPAAAGFMATLRSNPNFAEQMTHFPPNVLAPVLNVTTAHARLLLGYVQFLAFTYAKRAFAGMLGPPLGPGSSGPLVRRSFDEWHFGFRDPVLAALSPRNASTPWWAADGALSARARRVEEAPRWAALAAAVGRGEAPPGAEKRFFRAAMATGRPGFHLAEAGDMLEDNGVSRVAHAGGEVRVRGRAPGAWGFGDMSRTPNGMADRPVVRWYFGRSDMSIDPETTVGLGRVVPLTWQGRGPYMNHYIPALDYELEEETLTPCGGAAANASAAAKAAAKAACIYGDYIAGVWNLTHVAAAPVFLTRAHFYGAPRELVASLGDVAAASFVPDAATHNLRMTLDTAYGLPLVLSGSMQTVVGLRPSAVFFPRLWSGAPGPGGYMYLPAFWSKMRFEPDLAMTMGMYTLHTSVESGPRHTAGVTSLAGGVAAGFGAFSLWQMRLEERKAQEAAESKRASSISSSTADACGPSWGAPAADEEECFPAPRYGNNYN